MDEEYWTNLSKEVCIFHAMNEVDGIHYSLQEKHEIKTNF